jgi:hypothetical protein
MMDAVKHESWNINSCATSLLAAAFASFPRFSKVQATVYIAQTQRNRQYNRGSMLEILSLETMAYIMLL